MAGEKKYFIIKSNYYKEGFKKLDSTTNLNEILKFFLDQIEIIYLDPNEKKFKSYIDRITSENSIKKSNGEVILGLIDNYINPEVKKELLDKDNINTQMFVVSNALPIKNSKFIHSKENLTESSSEIIKESIQIKKLKDIIKEKANLKTHPYLSQRNIIFIASNGSYTDIKSSIIAIVNKINIEFKDFKITIGTESKNGITQENIYPIDVTNIGDKMETKNEQVFYNKIIFGPTGTGKSTWCSDYIKNNNIEENNVFKTTFYEDYTYHDFFGQYKPIVLRDSSKSITVKSFKQKNTAPKQIDSHIVTYQFVPGIFFNALIKALHLYKKGEVLTNDKKVLLVIDEINRGNCSSIFGDIFQLIDRDCDGNSSYSLSLSEDIKRFIMDMINDVERDSAYRYDITISETIKVLEDLLESNKVYMPSNLIMIATMNTSDQSLFPMDSAFKRRWDMQYCYINYNEIGLKDIKIEGTKHNWLSVLKLINDKIFEETKSEDKQIGQWFIKPKNNIITEYDFKNKLVSYLFFDVFKHLPQVLKSNSYSFLMNMKTNDIVELFTKKNDSEI